jgi:hypothetical protein
VFVRYSPYGTWKLTVKHHDSLQLDTVTDVRFEFNLQYKPGLFDGDPTFFDGDVGCLSELGAAGCAADGAVVPAPTPSPEPSHSDTGTGGDEPIVCTDYNGMNTLLTPLNSECCDEPSEDCSSGYPATCNSGCAALLLPLQAACADFLAASPMLAPVKATIDTAAATCPLPLPACTDYNDMNTLLTPLNSECCDEPSEDCSSGYPATCNSGCAALLLPLQAACADFLVASPMLAPVKAAIDTAAATCPASGSGH